METEPIDLPVFHHPVFSPTWLSPSLEPQGRKEGKARWLPATSLSLSSTSGLFPCEFPATAARFAPHSLWETHSLSGLPSPSLSPFHKGGRKRAGGSRIAMADSFSPCSGTGIPRFLCAQIAHGNSNLWCTQVCAQQGSLAAFSKPAPNLFPPFSSSGSVDWVDTRGSGFRWVPPKVPVLNTNVYYHKNSPWINAMSSDPPKERKMVLPILFQIVWDVVRLKTVNSIQAHYTLSLRPNILIASSCFGTLQFQW